MRKDKGGKGGTIINLSSDAGQNMSTFSYLQFKICLIWYIFCAVKSWILSTMFLLLILYQACIWYRLFWWHLTSVGSKSFVKELSFPNWLFVYNYVRVIIPQWWLILRETNDFLIKSDGRWILTTEKLFKITQKNCLAPHSQLCLVLQKFKSHEQKKPSSWNPIVWRTIHNFNPFYHSLLTGLRPVFGIPTYAASKWGVIGFTTSMAVSLILR